MAGQPPKRSAATIAVIALFALAACGDPCERLEEDFADLRREMITDPTKLLDPEFREEIGELSAELDEHDCGR